MDDEFTTVYPRICESYHAIRETRAKLLGFLPLVSSGLFALLAKDDPGKIPPGYLLLIGLNCALIASGLWVSEKENMKQLHDLFVYGKALEEKSGAETGTRVLCGERTTTAP